MKRYVLLSGLVALSFVIVTGFFDVAAAKGKKIDRVPRDFATIQDAVDNGTAPKIHVNSGAYAGATLTRSVELICNGECFIDQGVLVKGSQVGLILTADASGSTIRGFTFLDLDLGIYSSYKQGSLADNVTVEHNLFQNNAQAVNVIDLDLDQGDGWLIEHNEFVDLRTDVGGGCGGGLGINAFNVDGIAVLHNKFRGTVFAPPPCGVFSTAAVFLTGVDNGFVTKNDFTMSADGQPSKFDVALFGHQPGGGPNEDIVVANNDFRGSDAPFSGVHFGSFFNFDVAAQCNFGTTFIFHIGPGDGDFEFFTEKNCKRRDIKPSSALSRPAVIKGIGAQ